MKVKSIKSSPLLITAFLLVASACSSTPSGVKEFPATANAREELVSVEQDLSSALSSQVNVLSPKNFEEALDAKDDAKKMLQKGATNEKILKKIAISRAYLDQAQSVTEISKANIAAVVEAREAAIKAGAETHFSKQMKSADDSLKSLTKDIENQKYGSIDKKRGELQRKYMAIELDSIKEKYLGDSRRELATAKKEKAERFAPQTYALASKSITDTEEFINANRHNTTAIEARARETRASVDKAVKINRMAQSTTKASSEEVALSLESKAKAAAEAQSKLSRTEDRLSLTQSALQRTKSENASLEDEKERLEGIRRLEERYETASKMFNPNEAEVLKQGDALVIRLKSMSFPTAKAEIGARNKPVLDKVQKVVSEFGPSTVVIEGHTDSTGGKAINDKVSQDRAEAVKEYLTNSNKELSKQNTYEAIGLGYQKPLTSNKTADGRAKNRRVDIVITPEVTTL